MNDAALFALVDVAIALADELRRRFGEAGNRDIDAFAITVDGRKVSIAGGRDEARRGGATATRGAAATLCLEAAGDDLFLLALHARSRRGLRPVARRADRMRALDAAEGFFADVIARESRKRRAVDGWAKYTPARHRRQN